VDVLLGGGRLDMFPNGFWRHYDFNIEPAQANFADGEAALTYLLRRLSEQQGLWSPGVVHNLYRTQFLLDNELYFVKGLLNEDFDWTPRVLLAAQTVGFTPALFYVYRISRPGSTMTTANPKRLQDFLRIITTWYNRAREMENPTLARLIRQQFVYENLRHFIDSLKTLAPEDRPPVQELYTKLMAYVTLTKPAEEA
jgi:hypothetical protein